MSSPLLLKFGLDQTVWVYTPVRTSAPPPVVLRVLQVQPVSPRKLQLVGVTTVLVVCKYEEMDAPEVGDWSLEMEQVVQGLGEYLKSERGIS